MIELSDRPIDTQRLRESLEDSRAGGYAAFEGWVRNENGGREVRRLEYEVYEPLSLKEGRKIIAEARANWPLIGVRLVHRSGLLELGDCAVWVGVAARHRDEAFKACRYLIDELKVRLPIWKKEHYVNGDAGWVNCERCAGRNSGHGRDRAD